MKILGRYFIKQLIMMFIMLMMVLAGLSWMMQIMSMMKFLLNYGVEFDSFLGLTILMLPFIISIIVPFVTFIAVIFVYNKLIADNEVSVMVASGLSPAQLARPALVMAFVLTLAHLALNIWIVPETQARFYSTQWNLRYGLAHMKLQESAFTELSKGLVVYVDRASGHDMSQVMLSDTRDEKSQMIVFAEKGKLVSTLRGLSIVMTRGALQTRGDTINTGTFDTFDMDLNVSEKTNENSFRVRRIPTAELVNSVLDSPTKKQHKAVLSELSTRFLSPIMNLILTLLCTIILLRTSLLRRRASFAPAAAVLAMGVTMAGFMAASNMVTSLTGVGMVAMCLGIMLLVLTLILYKK